MNGSSQTQRYRNQPEEATLEKSKQPSKQPPHRHGMMRKQELCMSGLKRAWHGKVHKQSYKLSGAHYATELHIEENTT